MAKKKKYTFKVTATLCDEDKAFYDTREKVLKELKEWLELNENDSDLIGCSPFEKIEIV